MQLLPWRFLCFKYLIALPKDNNVVCYIEQICHLCKKNTLRQLLIYCIHVITHRIWIILILIPWLPNCVHVTNELYSIIYYLYSVNFFFPLCSVNIFTKTLLYSFTDTECKYILSALKIVSCFCFHEWLHFLFVCLCTDCMPTVCVCMLQT